MKDKEMKVINGEEHYYSAEDNEFFPRYKQKEVNGLTLNYELDLETWTYLPMLKVPEYEDYDIGFYGKEREKYLKDNFVVFHSNLLTSFELQPHLIEIDKVAYEMEDKLIEEYKKAEGVTEELKKADMFEWVGRMKNINSRVREVVLNELIYVVPYGNKNK